ncbi:unnamed protein product [Strongylus vulgaris]|uniref:Uncharacterized protein n=1 Tax=Strongylus vulgaris TaxID=40348 RepID=A0A3P7J926_STRVU|nr:unnamed protein product [Strongylus vulgaris]
MRVKIVNRWIGESCEQRQRAREDVEDVHGAEGAKHSRCERAHGIRRALGQRCRGQAGIGAAEMAFPIEGPAVVTEIEERFRGGREDGSDLGSMTEVCRNVLITPRLSVCVVSNLVGTVNRC